MAQEIENLRSLVRAGNHTALAAQQIQWDREKLKQITGIGEDLLVIALQQLESAIKQESPCCTQAQLNTRFKTVEFFLNENTVEYSTAQEKLAQAPHQGFVINWQARTKAVSNEKIMDYDNGRPIPDICNNIFKALNSRAFDNKNKECFINIFVKLSCKFVPDKNDIDTLLSKMTSIPLQYQDEVRRRLNQCNDDILDSTIKQPESETHSIKLNSMPDEDENEKAPLIIKKDDINIIPQSDCNWKKYGSSGLYIIARLTLTGLACAYLAFTADIHGFNYFTGSAIAIIDIALLSFGFTTAIADLVQGCGKFIERLEQNHHKKLIVVKLAWGLLLSGIAITSWVFTFGTSSPVNALMILKACTIIAVALKGAFAVGNGLYGMYAKYPGDCSSSHNYQVVSDNESVTANPYSTFCKYWA